MCFSLTGGNVSGRFFDKNSIALKTNSFPASLGLRPQALKLRFVGSEEAGIFFEPAVEETGELCPELPFRKGSNAGTKKLLFIGETASVIYSPFYCTEGCVYDAVLKERIHPTVKEEEIKKLPLPAAKWKLNFIPLLCPYCGADLPGEKSALVLFCTNCHNAWQSAGGIFEKINFSAYAASGGQISYLPFWRIKARFEGMKLDSFADLIRIANLPKAPSEKWNDIPFYFRIPAFKINPSLFLRWCRQMTSSFIEEEAAANEVPPQPVYPVTMPSAEATEAITVILADLTVDKRRLLPVLETLKSFIEDICLELHPFHALQKELIHKQSGIAVDKSALVFGSRI